MIKVAFTDLLMSSSQKTAQRTYRSVLEAVQHLIEVVAQLRAPEGGCPWDLEQTPQTLIPYVIEEAYEVVEAIRSKEQTAIAEELGDLLLQVVLQSQIASEAGSFSLKEVAQGITEKLIRRHPHVFGDVEVKSVDEVHRNWEQIKAAEKEPEATRLLSDKLSRYAQTLPPLIAGAKISQKAAEAGFEWPNVEGVWDKFEEELSEFKQALQSEDKSHQHAELGDLLFTLINIARWYKLDSFEALQETNQRFIGRLKIMERVAERPLSDHTLDELEALWQQAKAEAHQNKMSAQTDT